MTKITANRTLLNILSTTRIPTPPDKIYLVTMYSNTRPSIIESTVVSKLRKINIESIAATTVNLILTRPITNVPPLTSRIPTHARISNATPVVQTYNGNKTVTHCTSLVHRGSYVDNIILTGQHNTTYFSNGSTSIPSTRLHNLDNPLPLASCRVGHNINVIVSTKANKNRDIPSENETPLHATILYRRLTFY